MEPLRWIIHEKTAKKVTILHSWGQKTRVWCGTTDGIAEWRVC